jgi:hypothetical protein
MKRLGLRRRHRLQGPAPLIEHLPAPLLELTVTPQLGKGRVAVDVDVRPLSVDRHRRRDDQSLDSIPALDDSLEQHGRAKGIDRHVVLDLVHGLTDADGRALVEHHLDAL